MSPGPIIVTGAAGFAGQHVVRHLLAQGRPCEAWVHREPLPPGLAPDHVRSVDIRDAAACARAIRSARPGGLIHLAAVTSLREAARSPEVARAVNIEGTRNVLGPLPESVPAVFASTCHVYGHPTQLPLTEDAPLRPVGAYAESKAEAESAARAAHAPTVIARAFHHTGPGQSPSFALAQWARDIELGVSPVRTGDLSLRRDYTDVRDIARGYLCLLDQAPQGAVVNLCSGAAPTLGELLSLMAGDEPVETAPNPAWFRDHDPREIRGDAARARALGWEASTTMAQTLRALRRSLVPR
jgi:nucleoside-diphosphate-sugar epimerase